MPFQPLCCDLSHSPEHPTPTASVGSWGVLPNPHFSSSQAANGPLGQDTCASAQPCCVTTNPSNRKALWGQSSLNQEQFIAYFSTSTEQSNLQTPSTLSYR